MAPTNRQLLYTLDLQPTAPRPVTLRATLVRDRLRLAITTPVGSRELSLALDPRRQLSRQSLFLGPELYFRVRSFFRGQLQAAERGYSSDFIIRGIGYKFRFHRRAGQASASFKLGYGHRILFPLGQTEFGTNRRFDFSLFSWDRGTLRRQSEAVRLLRASDPYKGKGFKYYRAPLVLKVGKVR